MRKETVRTRNILLLGEAIMQLLAIRADFGGFGIVEAPADTGQTTAAKFVAKQCGAIYLDVIACPGPRSFYVSLLEQCGGWTEELHLHSLRGRLLYELQRKRYPALFLDNADRLDLKKNGVALWEVVRDIHDSSLSPIILFSAPDLARKLAHASHGYECLASRVVSRIRFERCAIEDAELLALRLVEDVKLDGDLIAHCLAASGGSLRPLLRQFAEIEQLAKTAGMRSLSLAKYRQLASFAGMPAAAPTPTRRVGRTAEVKRPKAA